MSKEIWQDIEGYEGLYQVSSMGRVKSLKRTDRLGRTVEGRILKPGDNGGGYLNVALCVGGKSKTHKVHRLVCEAFRDNPENKLDVNHLNEDKTDNRVCNLEWATRKENNNHGTHNERVANSLSKPIGQYTLGGELIRIWPSAKEAQMQTGFHRSNICAVANGKLKTAHNFIWKYVEEIK